MEKTLKTHVHHKTSIVLIQGANFDHEVNYRVEIIGGSGVKVVFLCKDITHANIFFDSLTETQFAAFKTESLL